MPTAFYKPEIAPRDPGGWPSPDPIAYVRLGGPRVAAVTEREAVGIIIDAAVNGRGHWTITANLDHVRRYVHEPDVRHLMDSADLVVADGMPLVWASRAAGAPLPERVAGSNMILSISEAAGAHDQSVFLLGGNAGVADRAAEILRERCPGLAIAGTHCPPRGFETDAEALARIEDQARAAKPDVVFVALGFPKQDRLIMRLRRALPEASFIGVGISLSYLAGDVPRAPAWSHRLGLEWLYRLMREPRRLARRYLLEGLPFAFRLFIGAARFRIDRDLTSWGWELPSSPPALHPGKAEAATQGAVVTAEEPE
jgi:N-acetylglucosaminyldiphosphoundecaprenol N-acetyl-beta-D-mannosaminyltransferase